MALSADNAIEKGRQSRRDVQLKMQLDGTLIVFHYEYYIYLNYFRSERNLNYLDKGQTSLLTSKSFPNFTVAYQLQYTISNNFNVLRKHA